MKKYSSGSFIDAAVRVYGSEADTISSFPATVYADGENAAALIKGNLQQSGTPTPSVPIFPNECGDLIASGEHAGQYTIPISSANTTTPIYLGEVQTTRNIKKLVLTGDEDWTQMANISETITRFYTRILTPTISATSIVSSHFKILSGNENEQHMRFGADSQMLYNVLYLFIPLDIASTLTELKTYLATQYAANTPVTIWFVLTEPTTGILNEPIRKIGNYADTVTATIPTVATVDNINVNTTLKPSAMDLTYTGWHDHSDKKRSGGAWV